MTQSRLLVGPFNRVEGDLEIRLEIDDGQVTAAYANSPLFRGFERILLSKPPQDALTITPRICGICSISQSVGAALALANAGGIRMPPQGERVAALLHGVENMADHLTHFYVFFMPDFARPTYEAEPWYQDIASRFTAVDGAGARQALDARARLFHIVGLLGGKWPHTLAIQPGGVTRAPTARDKVRLAADLRDFRRFLETELFGGSVEQFIERRSTEDLMAWDTGDAGLFLRAADTLGLQDLGSGNGRYLSWGAYPDAGAHKFASGILINGQNYTADADQVVEDLSHAWMLGPDAAPTDGQTLPDEAMRQDAYSWCKAPRYGGQTMETGALARQAVDGHPLALDLSRTGGVLARVGGRLLEIARLHVLLEDLVAGIQPEARFMNDWALPRNGAGIGLTEAARGSLGHWLRIEDGVLANYQIIAPTTWNFSPRDRAGVPGPVEAALVGAEVRPGDDTPLSVQHIVRSFDPCMNCTVH